MTGDRHGFPDTARLCTALSLRSAPPWCLALAVLLAVAQFAVSSGDQTPWIMMTQPTNDAYLGNTLLGHTAVHGGAAIHLENISTYRQVDMFNIGRSDYADFYFLRAMYALLAAFLIPFVGYWTGFALLNLILWIASIFAAASFCRRVGGDDLACGLVAILVALGSGWVFHAADFSAHSLSFALFYLFALGLWLTGVLFEERSWRTHLAIGAILGAGLLAYNTALYLLIAYAAFAFWHNRFLHVVAACVLALTIGSLWHWVLMAAGFGAWWLSGQIESMSFADFLAKFSLRNIEGRYFSLAAANWIATFQSGPAELLSTFARKLGQFGTFDAPSTVFAALASAIWLATRTGHGRFVAFAFCLTALTVGGSLFWSQSAGARGYLVYGISVFAYIAIGLAVSAIWRSPMRQARTAAILSVAILVASQALWSNAHLAGLHGPVKAYFLGLDHATGLFWHAPAAFSMTGAEPTPALFGGSASLQEAGLHEPEQAASEARGLRAFALALGSRAYPTAVLALILLLCLRGKARRIAFAGLVVFTVLPPLVQSLLVPRQSPPFYSPTTPLTQIASGTLTLAEGDRIELSFSIDPKFVSHLKSASQPGDKLLLGIPRADNVSFEARIGAATPIECVRLFCPVELAALSPAPDEPGRIVIRLLALSDKSLLSCWQRNPLPMRELSIVRRDGSVLSSACLPTVELRLVDTEGFLRIAGF